METSFVQRWRNGRQCYRPAGEVIVPREYEVAPISVKEAKAFVLEHHYLSRSYPACRFRFGLFRRGCLAGAAVFSHPCNDQVLSSIFRGDAVESVELGRFVFAGRSASQRRILVPLTPPETAASRGSAACLAFATRCREPALRVTLFTTGISV